MGIVHLEKEILMKQSQQHTFSGNDWRMLAALSVFIITLIVFIGISLPSEAKEIEPERLIVTGVTGDIIYIRPAESGESHPVTPFLALEDGDILTMAANAQLNVLFINRGIGETWRQGPKVLQVQSGQLLVQEQGEWQRKRPQLLKSLLFEPQKILAKSALLRLNDQTGPTPRTIPVIREIPKTEAVTIEKTYSVLRKEFGENDATPDLYRLSVLAEYGQYDRMLPLLKDLLTIHPDNPILLAWQKWVDSRR